MYLVFVAEKEALLKENYAKENLYKRSLSSPRCFTVISDPLLVSLNIIRKIIIFTIFPTKLFLMESESLTYLN